MGCKTRNHLQLWDDEPQAKSSRQPSHRTVTTTSHSVQQLGISYLWRRKCVSPPLEANAPRNRCFEIFEERTRAHVWSRVRQCKRTRSSSWIAATPNCAGDSATRQRTTDFHCNLQGVMFCNRSLKQTAIRLSSCEAELLRRKCMRSRTFRSC